MNTQKISCCYFPTTALLIDDNNRFLSGLCFDIDIKKVVLQLYDKPLVALQALKDYKPNPITNRCLLRPEERHRDHRNIDVDIRAIHEEMYNPNRFNEISVIVVDYSMPGMTGLELCQQLKNSPIKKILLTGEADEKLATKAFNEGIIHKFIRKDDPHFTDTINANIQELQLEYFQDLSEIVINSLTKNPDYPPSCLDDPIFLDFFYTLIEKHQFSEYYLMDAAGSFIFLDINGKPSWLVVKEEDMMNGDYFEAENSDIDVAPQVLESLKKKEKILYLHSDEDLQKDPSQWGPYLHKVSKLEGRATYYYAYITDNKLYDIAPEKIISFKKFSESH